MKIFCEKMAQPFERLKIVAYTKARNSEMKRLNWISTVKALYEHCISIEICDHELNLFVDRNIGKENSVVLR